MLSSRGSKFYNSFSVDGKDSGKQKYSLLIVSLLAAMQSFSTTVKGEIILMKVTTSRITPPPGIGSTFVACHLLLLQATYSFQLLVDLGLSKKNIGSELIHGVEEDA